MSASFCYLCGSVVLLVGALLGLGCNAGCSYVRKHVDVAWKP